MIGHAQTVISWQENLPSDEMPPEWMWPFDKEIEAWFQEVKRARDEKYGGGSDSREDPGDMMENDLVSEFKKRGKK